MNRSIFLLGLVPVLAATYARADESADALFREARRLVEQGRIAEACSKFAESQRLEPAPGTLLNLADCYEQNGQTASAWEAYKEAARTADPKRVQWKQLATERAAALEKRLATLSISLPPDAPADIEIRRDDRVVSAGELRTPIPVDPGTHVLTATAKHRRPWSQKLDVRGVGVTVNVAVPSLLADEPAAPKSAEPRPAAAAEASTPSSAPSPPLPSSPSSTRRTWALALGGFGIAALGVGAATGFVAISKRSDASDRCTSYPDHCSPEGAALNEDAKTWATVSTISLAVGAASAGAGIVLWLTAPKASASRGLVVVPIGSLGAGLRGQF